MPTERESSPSGPPQLARRPAFVLRRKLFSVWVLSLLVLLLAVFLSFGNTHFIYWYFKRILFSFHLPSPSLLQNLLVYLGQTQRERQSLVIASEPSLCVLWMAPFLSGGGYCSESWSYITSLDIDKSSKFRLRIEHHGDEPSIEFWNGLPDSHKRLAYKLHGTQCNMNETIVICHSEPGAWYPPLFETLPCPPYGYEEPMFVVGRTMFETDRLNPEHVQRCNQMNSVWVPTDYHVTSFAKSGVEASKLVKIVQPIDHKFFDPSKYEPFDLPISSGRLVLGSGFVDVNKNHFVFISVFKWEARKGWDLLLRAYLEEFSKADCVVLYILTKPYHSDRDIASIISRYVKESGIEEPSNGWASVSLIEEHIAQSDLPKFYRTADVFVLPTRGEGWGRPIVEAMAMAVPVIATNWSGPTEYLNDDNGYLLSVDRMTEVEEGPFKGHLWAEPSVNKLRVLMRHAKNNYEEARRKGIKAREDMVRRFSPEAVADTVVHQIMKISSLNLQAPVHVGRII